MQAVAFFSTRQPLTKYITLQKYGTTSPELLVFLIFNNDSQEDRFFNICLKNGKMYVEPRRAMSNCPYAARHQLRNSRNFIKTRAK